MAAQHSPPDPLPAQLSPAKAAQELRSLAHSFRKADIQLKLKTVGGPYPRPYVLVPVGSQHDSGVRFRRAVDA